MGESIIYTLEDNNDYLLLDSLIYNNSVYVLLSEVENGDNICIRKFYNDNNELVFKRLSDEFQTVYNMFIDKNKRFLEK